MFFSLLALFSFSSTVMQSSYRIFILSINLCALFLIFSPDLLLDLWKKDFVNLKVVLKMLIKLCVIKSIFVRVSSPYTSDVVLQVLNASVVVPSFISWNRGQIETLDIVTRDSICNFQNQLCIFLVAIHHLKSIKSTGELQKYVAYLRCFKI